jgi:hypothetical protein
VTPPTPRTPGIDIAALLAQIDSVQADLDASYCAVANEQERERYAREEAQGRFYDAVDDVLLPTVRALVNELERLRQSEDDLITAITALNTGGPNAAATALASCQILRAVTT